MKPLPTRSHAANAAAQLVPVRFEFTHPKATSVSVVGTFNDLRPEAIFLDPVGNGRWLKEMLLPPGTYEYCLVVDDQYMPDPGAKHYVSNPFGGRNSVLKVVRAATANFPLEMKPASPAVNHLAT